MLTKPFWIAFVFAFFSISVCAQSAATSHHDDLVISGWLENVVLAPWQIKLRAKLDTGAKTSSLHAINIQRFKRDGQPWVRFSTEDKKNDAVTKTIAMPIKREVKIKSHHRDATSRPVVMLSFCLNGKLYEGEFSLIDRQRFNYPVLLGRRILQQGILVDASSTFILPIHSPSCEQFFDKSRPGKGKAN